MITTFKTFNIKTKEVKEYSKPEFGEFGEYILIKADDFDTLAFNIEHTALFSDDKKETIERLKTLAIAISVTYNKNKFNKNSDHELNTLHNGLFKDCIYTSGDWVGVLFHCFRYDYSIQNWNNLSPNYSIVIKSGDWFNNKFLFVYENFSFKMYEQITNWSKEKKLLLVDINQKISTIYFGLFLNAKEIFDNNFSKYDKLNSAGRMKKLLELDLERTENSKIKIDKNIIDEYFTKNN
jgi:hypothetical protein